MENSRLGIGVYKNVTNKQISASNCESKPDKKDLNKKIQKAAKITALAGGLSTLSVLAYKGYIKLKLPKKVN